MTRQEGLHLEQSRHSDLFKVYRANGLDGLSSLNIDVIPKQGVVEKLYSYKFSPTKNLKKLIWL